MTKLFLFSGSELFLNVSTSAAGSVRVELQDKTEHQIEGFAISDCEPIYGDELERVVRWNGGSDVSHLNGVPVRLRFVMDDADLFAMQWK